MEQQHTLMKSDGTTLYNCSVCNFDLKDFLTAVWKTCSTSFFINNISF